MSRVAAPSGSLDINSDAIQMSTQVVSSAASEHIEESPSSCHFLDTIADMSPVKASHEPSMNLAVASAASATGTEVNVIPLESNQSTMLPSVVVPIPTQILAPFSPLAELLALAAGNASSRTRIPCPSKKFIPAKSAFKSASRLVVQVVVRISTSIVPEASLSNRSEPEAGIYSTSVSGFNPRAAATARQ